MGWGLRDGGVAPGGDDDVEDAIPKFEAGATEPKVVAGGKGRICALSIAGQMPG